MRKCFEFEIRNSEKIHDVGFRLKLANRIPDDLGFRIDNFEDSVKVILKGEESLVRSAYERLKKEFSGTA